MFTFYRTTYERIGQVLLNNYITAAHVTHAWSYMLLERSRPKELSEVEIREDSNASSNSLDRHRLKLFGIDTHTNYTYV